jgi:hypothetical protein
MYRIPEKLGLDPVIHYAHALICFHTTRNETVVYNLFTLVFFSLIIFLWLLISLTSVLFAGKRTCMYLKILSLKCNMRVLTCLLIIEVYYHSSGDGHNTVITPSYRRTSCELQDGPIPPNTTNCKS